MTKKIKVPLLITADLRYILERGKKFLYPSKDSNKQNERIIKDQKGTNYASRII